MINEVNKFNTEKNNRVINWNYSTLNKSDNIKKFKETSNENKKIIISNISIGLVLDGVISSEVAKTWIDENGNINENAFIGYMEQQPLKG